MPLLFDGTAKHGVRDVNTGDSSFLQVTLKLRGSCARKSFWFFPPYISV